MGAFTDLLATFSDEADRKAFEELGNKNPKIRESVLRQSDYSRKMDEVRDQLAELQKWKDWRTKHWDPEKQLTKREIANFERMEQLEAEKEQLEERLLTQNLGHTGDDMTLEQLNQWGETFAKNKGMVTKADLESTIKAKETELQNFVNNQVKTQAQFETYASLTVPELNIRHTKEFGDPFDSEAFLKEATEKGRFNLKDFYETSFVVGRRSEKLKADHTAELERVKTESEAKVAAAQAELEAAKQRAANMGPNGLIPTDNEGSQMGPLQRKFLKMDEKPPEEGKAPEVPLGEGGIAAFAAKKFLQDQASRVA